MSVDAALSLGSFIKLLVTFELDSGEEVRLGELSDVSICTDTDLCIFIFSSAAEPCRAARLWKKIIIILVNIVIMVIYCNTIRSGQCDQND